MRNRSKSMLVVLLSVFACMLLVFTVPKKADAASKFITVEEFAKEIADKLIIGPVTGKEKSGYVNALLELGIIKDGEFKSYTKEITRGEAAALINRADEYLYGDTLDPKLVELALEKRISDINKAKKSFREDIVKCYLKGFIKGYSNGAYSSDREFRVNSRITRSGALNCLKMLRDKTLRAKLSPDGQLLRTSNLPEKADMYPYILASYPNEYYDRRFIFEGATIRRGGEDPRPMILGEDYAPPSHIRETTRYNNFATAMDNYLDTWVDRAVTYLEQVLNVDYRTIDDEWYEEVYKTFGNSPTVVISDEKFEKYKEDVKKTKTIIETEIVACDGSSLHFWFGQYYLRAYVKYRIVSCNVPNDYTDGIYLFSKRPYNAVVFSPNDYVNLSGYEVGEWRERFISVRLSTYKFTDGEDFGVQSAFIY